MDVSSDLGGSRNITLAKTLQFKISRMVVEQADHFECNSCVSMSGSACDVFESELRRQHLISFGLLEHILCVCMICLRFSHDGNRKTLS